MNLNPPAMLPGITGSTLFPEERSVVAERTARYHDGSGRSPLNPPAPRQVGHKLEKQPDGMRVTLHPPGRPPVTLGASLNAFCGIRVEYSYGGMEESSVSSTTMVLPLRPLLFVAVNIGTMKTL